MVNINININIPINYFLDYYNYYKTINWSKYQQKMKLPTKFIAFKLYDIVYIEGNKIKVVIYLFSDKINEWKYNLCFKINDNDGFEYRSSPYFNSLEECLIDLNNILNNDINIEEIDYIIL